MKYINKSWFTLIEMIIATTIFFIIVVASYANYAYYQNKASLRIWVKEISQSINEARNLAINWLNLEWKNQDTFVYFDFNNDTSLKIFSAPFDLENDPILNFDFASDFNISLLEEVKTLDFPRWVSISSNLSNNLLLRFNSISWYSTIYKLDSSLSIIDDSLEDILIEVSFNRSSIGVLNNTIQYFKNTNMIDY